MKFKPATITHPCIEKDLLYTGMCQAFRFDSYCSCCRGILAWCRKTLVLGSVKFRPASTTPSMDRGRLALHKDVLRAKRSDLINIVAVVGPFLAEVLDLSSEIPARRLL